MRDIRDMEAAYQERSAHRLEMLGNSSLSLTPEFRRELQDEELTDRLVTAVEKMGAAVEMTCDRVTRYLNRII